MIKIDIAATINSALNAIKNFQQQTNKTLDTMANQGKSAFDTIGKATVFLNQGLELAGKAFGAFNEVVAAGIAASVQQEEAINDLNQAMKSSGTFTNKASEEIQNFSSYMQKNSTFADEVILKTSALGVTLGKLSGQQLKDAILAAANMASALGIDLDSAMQRIVKSSIDGGAGLRKYGISVEKGATGSLTLANAIEKINDQFSGAAASKVATYKGALDQANNAYGDMLEKVGEFVTRNPLVVKMINIASKAFDEVAAIIGKFSPAPFNNLVANGVIKLIEAMVFLVDAINPVIGSFKALYAVATGVINAMKTGFNTVLTVVSGVVLGIATALNNLISLIPARFVPEGWTESMLSFQETMTTITESTAKLKG